MLATIASLVLGLTGAGLGYAGWHTATRSAVKQREQIALIANEVVRHSIRVAAETSKRSEEGLMSLSAQLGNLEVTALDLRAQLEGLENTAFEQLITRGEVSAAFAELAAIEEQRQRQAAAVRATAPAPIAAGNPMPSPAASPIPTWLLLVLMAIGAKRQRVDRRGSEAAGDGDECKGRDGQGCPFSIAEYKQRRESNGFGNGLKRYCNRRLHGTRPTTRSLLPTARSSCVK
jgi:hypothetical protein